MLPQSFEEYQERRRKHHALMLAWLETHIGLTVLVKDRFTSQYLKLTGPGDDKYYRVHGRDGSGKFRLEDVTWAESDTIWLGSEGDN